MTPEKEKELLAHIEMLRIEISNLSFERDQWKEIANSEGEEIERLITVNEAYIKTVKSLQDKLNPPDEWTECIRGEE